MDILALPEDVLYEIIGALPLRDRLRMRKTCRAFASLIANSNFSSPFENTITITAKLIDQIVADTRDTWCKPMQEMQRKPTSEIMVRISLGDLWFKPIARDDLSVAELMQGLFRSCNVETVIIHLRGSVLTFEYLRALIGSCKIQELIVHGTEKNVKIALELFTYFPLSKHCLVFNALPSRNALCSLPPLHHLKLLDMNVNVRPNWALDISDLSHLISIHNNITCANLMVSAGDIKELTQVISKYIDRSVTISVHKDKMKYILMQLGVEEDSTQGVYSGEYSIRSKDAKGKTAYSNCMQVSQMKLNSLSEKSMRQIIRKMSLNNRLKLRRTCRALNHLVVKTPFILGKDPVRLRVNQKPHYIIKMSNISGIFSEEFELSHKNSAVALRIYDARLLMNSYNGAEDELFESCSVSQLTICIDRNMANIEMLFKMIRILCIDAVNTTRRIHSDTAKKIFAAFPMNRCLDINVLPTRYDLFSLPPLFRLKITDEHECSEWTLGVDEIRRLLNLHKHISCTASIPSLSASDFTEILKEVSNATDRSFAFTVEKFQAKNFLDHFGIALTAREGETVEGQFRIQRNDIEGMLIRYTNCMMSFDGINAKKVSNVKITLYYSPLKY